MERAGNYSSLYGRVIPRPVSDDLHVIFVRPSHAAVGNFNLIPLGIATSDLHFGTFMQFKKSVAIFIGCSSHPSCSRHDDGIVSVNALVFLVEGKDVCHDNKDDQHKTCIKCTFPDPENADKEECTHREQ